MKIDLQELKRLAGPGRIGEVIHVETRSLKALVDVVEKAQAVATEGLRAKRQFVSISHAPVDALRAALTTFTESTNEEA